MKKQLAILGSTGSIGTQALEVVRSCPELFTIRVLTAMGNCELLIRQAIEFSPSVVVIGKENCYPRVAEALKQYPIEVMTGEQALSQVVEMDGIDMVLTAMVGYAGLLPTLRAIRAGRDIALANKETLVIAGGLVMSEARKSGVRILPVDSEHSAIHQCLAGETHQSIDRIHLTASGGPFFGMTREQLATITKEDALRHPNWKMGHKITIDSASLMNKGLEVIEARWLFDLRPEQIEVVIHPQSVIHSLVRFIDGSIKAQLGLPDMKLPILYALAWPQRVRSGLPSFNFTDYPQLTFHEPDPKIFRSLALAIEAMKSGGNMPCILNAANEAAVRAFLSDRIGFLEIAEVVEHCMYKASFVPDPGYEDYAATHAESVVLADEFISSHTLSS